MKEFSWGDPKIKHWAISPALPPKFYCDSLWVEPGRAIWQSLPHRECMSGRTSTMAQSFWKRVWGWQTPAANPDRGNNPRLVESGMAHCGAGSLLGGADGDDHGHAAAILGVFGVKLNQV